MYSLGKVMKSGRSVDPDQAVIPSVATTYVLDMTQALPRWRQTQSMAFARAYHTLTLLPDGNGPRDRGRRARLRKRSA